MESLDLRVLGDALAWRHSGRGVTLVTVVETWGSAPRPPGAMLAVRDDGVVSGSVSGGCVEDDLIARIKAEYGQPMTVVATGGVASLFEGALPSIDTFDSSTDNHLERGNASSGWKLELWNYSCKSDYGHLGSSRLYC